MAPPKRARTTGTSRSHQSSDSDSSGGYQGEKFISPEAQAEYKRLMSKTVIRERGFLPTSLDGDLVKMIEELGWVDFCEAPIPVPLTIVREFYANAKAEGNGYAVVRGLTVDYTPRAIRDVLRLPGRPEGAEDWTEKTRADVDLDVLIAELCVPGTVWTTRKGTTEQVSFPAASMNKYARAWNSFLCANIMPVTHSHEVTVDRAIVLYAILNVRYLDLGYLINQNIRRFMRGGTTGVIPHASIVTKLCRAVGVSWSDDEPLQQPSAAIDSASIARLAEWPGGTPDPRGLGYTVFAERGGQPPRRPPRVASGSASGGAGPSGTQGAVVSSDSQHRQLLRRFDAFYETHRRFATDLTQTLDGIYQQQGIQVTWPVFGAHTVYPPPDSPPAEDADD